MFIVREEDGLLFIEGSAGKRWVHDTCRGVKRKKERRTRVRRRGRWGSVLDELVGSYLSTNQSPMCLF